MKKGCNTFCSRYKNTCKLLKILKVAVKHYIERVSPYIELIFPPPLSPTYRNLLHYVKSRGYVSFYGCYTFCYTLREQLCFLTFGEDY